MTKVLEGDQTERVWIDEMQFGFVSFINKHSEKVPGCNLAFVDLEKAFNRVPKDVIVVGG